MNTRRQRGRPANPQMAAAVIALSVGCLVPAVASVLLAWPDADSFAILLPPALVAAVVVLLVLPFWPANTHHRMLAAAMALATVIMSATHLWPEFSQRTRESAPRTDAAIVILYWKMDRASDALERTVNILRSSKADALMLEETDSALGLRLDDRLKDLYPYRSLCRATCGYAIFSRRPIVAEQRWKADGPALIWVRTTDRRGEPATLVNAHIPAGDIRSTSTAIARELPPAMRGSMVLAGDMNMMPWSHTMRQLDLLLRPMTRATHWLPSWPGEYRGWKSPVALMPFDQIYIGDQWKSATISRIPNAPSGHYPLLMSLTRQADSSE